MNIQRDFDILVDGLQVIVRHQLRRDPEPIRATMRYIQPRIRQFVREHPDDFCATQYQRISRGEIRRGEIRRGGASETATIVRNIAISIGIGILLSLIHFTRELSIAINSTCSMRSEYPPTRETASETKKNIINELIGDLNFASYNEKSDTLKNAIGCALIVLSQYEEHAENISGGIQQKYHKILSAVVPAVSVFSLYLLVWYFYGSKKLESHYGPMKRKKSEEHDAINKEEKNKELEKYKEAMEKWANILKAEIIDCFVAKVETAQQHPKMLNGSGDIIKKINDTFGHYKKRYEKPYEAHNTWENMGSDDFDDNENAWSIY